jgi:hypothetical protein
MNFSTQNFKFFHSQQFQSQPIQSQPKLSGLQPVNRWLQNFLSYARAHFLGCMTNPNELKVWVVRDRQGRHRWYAYDPRTNRSAAGLSEAELRVWLEQRYA